MKKLLLISAITLFAFDAHAMKRQNPYNNSRLITLNFQNTNTITVKKIPTQQEITAEIMKINTALAITELYRPITKQPIPAIIITPDTENPAPSHKPSKNANSLFIQPGYNTRSKSGRLVKKIYQRLSSTCIDLTK